MRIAPDTNLFVRLLTNDDPAQAIQARDAMRAADQIVVPIATVLELVWVLQRVYWFDRDQVEAAVRGLLDVSNIVTDRQALVVGLRALKEGGDFVDGVIAGAGMGMGADVFASFDRKAVECLKRVGIAASDPKDLQP